ncbi:protein GPR108-like isoform X1 [Pomacea canaliculata]|uniref:protein GPR108-like isoform X1 n=1 Tax=Pomacea canaliculata TaxID=400727 RepID=UPI000D73E8D2|nr:protein GPR108-like isoform X1 [Pomacea canaliculata]
MEPPAMGTKRNKKLFQILLLSVLLAGIRARSHKLKLEDDDRKQIIVSTFGFLTGGTLAVNLTHFTFKPRGPLANKAPNETMFGFTLDKSKSKELSSFMEKMQGSCPVDELAKEKEQTNDVQTVMFQLNLNQKKLFIIRKGKEMNNLVISPLAPKTFHEKHSLNRRAVGAEPHLSELSDDFLFKIHHVKRVQRDAAPTLAPSLTTVPGTTMAETQALNQSGSSLDTADENADASKKQSSGTSSDQSEALINELDIMVENVDNVQVFSVYFLVWIQNPNEEGLYNLYFHNCLNYKDGNHAFVNLSVEIIEENNGNFLTAGEMPVPALYFTFSVVFFIMGVAWFSVLRRSKEGVYKIHYLMLVVVAVKSQANLFHGVNMYFIQKTGIHEDAWAILWYIVYLTRGVLMFVTVLLIGAGWAFIKHVLTDHEKKLFIIFIPLQILDSVAWVIVEESEEGNQSYTTWKEIFILVDLLCCGAILFPVVWSIRHLQEASNTDGKAAINLQKLKLFRHFYIMVVCYIYFTRIIVYLLKITLPFKFEWLTDLFSELAMLIFFVVTAMKFRPASDNPYLQVPVESDDEEIEMEEVLTKTGATDSVVKVNQKTQGSNNQLLVKVHIAETPEMEVL